ncbi:hypothetical protein SAVCW2_47050 [Streptomyces avermitilis]|nr:hypothetical protein SAVCW2_47050 [Streptomyces avermitilis]
MSPRAGSAGPHTLAFVESPVQLLNVLEWAYTNALHDPGAGLTLVVLSPTDPMTRGQLRRMAELARDEGYEVRWEEARAVRRRRSTRSAVWRACCAGRTGSSWETPSPATYNCC